MGDVLSRQRDPTRWGSWIALSPCILRLRTGRAIADGYVVNHSRILLIEDEMPAMRLMAWALSQHGYQVVAAANGEEAIGLAEDGRTEEPSIIIFSTAAPEERRVGQAERFRQIIPGVRILDVHDHA